MANNLTKRCEMKNVHEQARDVIDNLNKSNTLLGRKYKLTLSECDLCRGYNKECVGYMPETANYDKWDKFMRDRFEDLQ